ncbi:GNAT family N-acetyltransferase [Methanobrevibacter filiformis]|uniref:Mycothiol acetyltransferase n=1 Tax=Methanobrevibacter filiformis TaxID=55758 RepID=A0A162FHZ6_9EURY|nr:GNAT family N-acetyltransferase [Methanobrevibacter filiformis]KZX10240.1 mycothiol acetyltransferase [Methanobrevibacter filiformis]
MILEEFNLNKHDDFKLAELIFSVDYSTFLRLFKSRDLAISAIKRRLIVQNTIINRNSRNSSKTLVLIDNEQNLIGLLLIVKGRKDSFLSTAIFLLKNLRLDLALKFIFIEIMDYLVLAKFNSDDLYLAELAIDSENQGKGYGKVLLNETVKIAKKRGFKRVVLDVELNNSVAIDIYKKFGFKIFNKRTDRIFNGKRGMYNMEYIV